ncbi:MAG: cation:proton antiporter [Spongiibacteraceae bacterium]|nr:cation:proton antiporter [Spongiibacteraceae bacterium]
MPANLRQSLNVESGLNNGICVPILFVFLTLAAGGGQGSGNHSVLTLLAEELGIGLLVGVVLVVITVYLLRYAHSKNWLTHTWIQLPVIALSITCFATAQYVGGSGFIAAFCGGLLFGHLLKDQYKEFLRAAEGVGDTFALITCVLFGSAVVGHSIPNLTWPIIGYALLSLTLIRMLPIFISLLGDGVAIEGQWFLGWFGAHRFCGHCHQCKFTPWWYDYHDSCFDCRTKHRVTWHYR